MEMNLGELISSLYDHFMALYNDEELASVATAATVNEILAGQKASIMEAYAA